LLINKLHKVRYTTEVYQTSQL